MPGKSSRKKHSHSAVLVLIILTTNCVHLKVEGFLNTLVAMHGLCTSAPSAPPHPLHLGSHCTLCALCTWHPLHPLSGPTPRQNVRDYETAEAFLALVARFQRCYTSLPTSPLTLATPSSPLRHPLHPCDTPSPLLHTPCQVLSEFKTREDFVASAARANNQGTTKFWHKSSFRVSKY